MSLPFIYWYIYIFVVVVAVVDRFSQLHECAACVFFNSIVHGFVVFFDRVYSRSWYLALHWKIASILESDAPGARRSAQFVLYVQNTCSVETHRLLA